MVGIQGNYFLLIFLVLETDYDFLNFTTLFSLVALHCNLFYHIFVRKTYLFACVINEEVPDPSVPGVSNRLLCPASMTSL